jgi:hypothetical protein
MEFWSIFPLVSGRRREDQDPRHHCSAHQAARHRRQQVQDTRTWSSVSSESLGQVFSATFNAEEPLRLRSSVAMFVMPCACVLCYV